jgi:glutathione peroxidase
MSEFFDLPLGGLNGAELDLGALAGRAVLVVNVASRCGLTPQYAGLERLQRRYREERFSVLGVPCNQFANQEPDTEDQIRTFCSATYGTTFPITEKLEVNGPRRHRLYRKLVDTADSDGRAGDVDWNFEKFLVSGAGEVRARFRPGADPESEEVIQAIESVLADPSSRLTDTWETAPASGISVGDRVRPRDGIELTVTRIETPFFGRSEMLALIEATEDGWLKVPVAADSPVEVRRRLS